MVDGEVNAMCNLFIAMTELDETKCDCYTCHIETRGDLKLNTGKALIVAVAMKEMSRQQLADKMGVSVITLRAMCRAKSATTDTMKRAADALGMRVSELIALGE